jgi:hypothetical protein
MRGALVGVLPKAVNAGVDEIPAIDMCGELRLELDEPTLNRTHVGRQAPKILVALDQRAAGLAQDPGGHKVFVQNQQSLRVRAGPASRLDFARLGVIGSIRELPRRGDEEVVRVVCRPRFDKQVAKRPRDRFNVELLVTIRRHDGISW